MERRELAGCGLFGPCKEVVARSAIFSLVAGSRWRGPNFDCQRKTNGNQATKARSRFFPFGMPPMLKGSRNFTHFHSEKPPRTGEGAGRGVSD